MTFSLKEDINAILLPAFGSTTLSDETKQFLDEGGISILLGETREEYVARRVTDERRATETPETFTKVINEAKSLSDTLLVCVDQEIGGTCRMHDLVPQFPKVEDIPATSSEEIENISFQVGKTSAAMGVNCFLAPVLDLLSGVNPWLQGRTYSTDPETVGRVSSAFVRGVQSAGVVATGKHFPGFHNIDRDPAIDPDAVNVEAAETFEPGFKPFRDVIAANIEMIMVGPAITKAFDEKVAALRSKPVVDKLKYELGYQGIVMADDLDSQATMRGDSVEQVAIDAVNAGCDFLLLADMNNQLKTVSEALLKAVELGNVSGDGIAQSAQKMRNLAQKYATKF